MLKVHIRRALYRLIKPAIWRWHGRGGHGHNDTFSFELCCDEKPLVVGSGTSTHSTDARSRNEFQSSAAYNVLVVDK